MIHYKGHTISAEFNGISKPEKQTVRRLSACGTVGMSLLGSFATVDDAKSAIDALDDGTQAPVRVHNRYQAAACPAPKMRRVRVETTEGHTEDGWLAGYDTKECALVIIDGETAWRAFHVSKIVSKGIEHEPAAPATPPATLHERIAAALGWTLADVQSASMQSLRDLVRPVDAALAAEMSASIQTGSYVRGSRR